MKYPLKAYISDNSVVLVLCFMFITLLTIYSTHEEYNTPGQNFGLWIADIFFGSMYVIVFTIDYFKQKKLFKKENK